MPIYEYECGKCSEVFEVFQKHSDPPPKSHSCGGRKVRRVMSASAFVLKGEGWYITDYARKEQKAKDKKNKASESSDAGTKKKEKSASKASAA